MMNLSKIVIGITGTQGAGKDTAARFFIEKGFEHFSLSDILKEKLEQQNKELTRDNYRVLGDELRTQYGNGAMAKLLMEQLDNSIPEKILITSIRHPEEVHILKKSFPQFVLLSVDAPIELRFQRIKERGRQLDNVTLEQYKQQEEAENVELKVGLRVREAMLLADHTVLNDNDMETLYTQLEEIYKKII